LLTFLFPLVFSNSFEQRFLESSDTETSLCPICKKECSDFDQAYKNFPNRPDAKKVLDYNYQAASWEGSQQYYYLNFQYANKTVKDIYAAVQSFTNEPLVKMVHDTLWPLLQKINNRYPAYELLRQDRVKNYQLILLYTDLTPFYYDYIKGDAFAYIYKYSGKLDQLKELCGLDPCPSLSEITEVYKHGHIADLPFTLPPKINYSDEISDFDTQEWYPLTHIKANLTDPLLQMLSNAHQACSNEICYNLTGLEILSSNDIDVQNTFIGIIKEVKEVIDKNLDNAKQTMENILAIPMKIADNIDWYLPTVKEWPSISTPTFQKMYDCYDIILNAQN